MKGKIILDGQTCFYADDIHTLYVTIKEPFKIAGKMLDWTEDTTEGLGFNDDIMNFIKKYKCHFVVYIESEQKYYWIEYDKIADFVAKNRTEYTLKSGKKLHVISRAKFIFVPQHIET